MNDLRLNQDFKKPYGYGGCLAAILILYKLRPQVPVTRCSYSSNDYERPKPNDPQDLHIEDVTYPIEYLTLVDMHEMSPQAASLHHCITITQIAGLGLNLDAIPPIEQRGQELPIVQVRNIQGFRLSKTRGCLDDSLRELSIRAALTRSSQLRLVGHKQKATV